MDRKGATEELSKVVDGLSLVAEQFRKNLLSVHILMEGFFKYPFSSMTNSKQHRGVTFILLGPVVGNVVKLRIPHG